MPSRESLHPEDFLSDVDYISEVWLEPHKIPPPSELILFLNASLSQPVLTRQERHWVETAYLDLVAPPDWGELPWEQD